MQTPVEAGLCTGGCNSSTAKCTAPACTVYECRKSTTSLCSVSCGSGVITTTAQCLSTAFGAQTPVEAALCLGGCTSSTAACTVAACPVYECQKTTGLCSVSCGTGIVPTIAKCMNVAGGSQTQVDASLCLGGCNSSAAPCPRVTLCPVYKCFLTTSACSVTCGSGIIKTTAQCMDAAGGSQTPVNNYLCPPSVLAEAPAGSLASGRCTSFNSMCTVPGPPCPVYECQRSFGPCSVTCGSGIQTITARCMNIAAVSAYARAYPVNASLCIDEHRRCTSSTEASCTAPACPVYECQRSTTPCSVTCGSGVQSTTAQCINKAGSAISNSSKGVPVDSSLCIGGCTSSTASCTAPPCIPSGTITRIDSYTSPPTCIVPADCAYKCASSYRITTSGTAITLMPVLSSRQTESDGSISNSDIVQANPEPNPEAGSAGEDSASTKQTAPSRRRQYGSGMACL